MVTTLILLFKKIKNEVYVQRGENKALLNLAYYVYFRTTFQPFYRMIDYNNKTFKSLSNSTNGEVSEETVFKYKQEGNVLSGSYSGGGIQKGNLIGTVDEHGVIKMKYCHINSKGEIKSGKCTSKPSPSTSGKIRLHEQWQWTSGDFSKGESIIEEV